MGWRSQDAPLPVPSTGRELPHQGHRGKSRASFTFCLCASLCHLGGEGGHPVWLCLLSHDALNRRRAFVSMSPSPAPLVGGPRAPSGTAGPCPPSGDSGEPWGPLTQMMWHHRLPAEPGGCSPLASHSTRVKGP